MNAAALQRLGYSVPTLRALAGKRLPRMLFDMVEGAAGDETTMRRNEAALAAIEFAPKLLERGPLLIKGLLHPREASEAINRGVDEIIVSNHGGRQLDGAVASISALPGVVDAVGGRAPVMIDGGFRRGVDVVKALALGARAVLIGRPHLWASPAPARTGSTGCSTCSGARSIARWRSAAGTALPGSIGTFFFTRKRPPAIGAKRRRLTSPDINLPILPAAPAIHHCRATRLQPGTHGRIWRSNTA